jgi:hypothetical protein
MEEEFYAIIKLISGEEILSKVCPCDEDDRIILILDDPIIMETILIRKLEMTTIKVTPWIKFSNNRMFVMDMKNVITMTEVDDEDLIHIHQKYVREKNKKSNKSELTSKMGYLSSIADARITLEKLYKSI